MSGRERSKKERKKEYPIEVSQTADLDSMFRPSSSNYSSGQAVHTGGGTATRASSSTGKKAQPSVTARNSSMSNHEITSPTNDDQRFSDDSAPDPSKIKLRLDLPPLSDPKSILVDLVGRAIEMKEFGSFKKDVLAETCLKIGTMCSGTESPIIALKEICRQSNIRYVHEFSAEIEPFKAAYIQANFKPKVLMRDVTDQQCRNETIFGTTCFGKEIEWPHVDILIAGSSCKDLSGLNKSTIKSLNQRKLGESSTTFNAVTNYCFVLQPAIVILENVRNPDVWRDFEDNFRGIGYETQKIDVDSKDFGLPQTRQRTYMLALCMKKFDQDQLGDNWRSSFTAVVKALQRPASSPVSDFLATSDEIVAASNALASYYAEKKVSSKGWERNRSRHAVWRLINELGIKSPFLRRKPEYASASFFSRPTREKDLLSARHLTMAKDTEGDDSYKALVYNISQSVERGGTTIPFGGITGCITPKGTPWASDQRRMITGFEALRLQGITTDGLRLTNLSDTNLSDMAGNAMTCPVVGAVILSALKTCLPNNSIRNGRPPDLPKQVHDQIKPMRGGHIVEVETSRPTANLSDRIKKHGDISDKKCLCDGYNGLAPSPIYRCAECDHTICADCEGNIEHVFDRRQPVERGFPTTFLYLLAPHIPPVISLRTSKSTTAVLKDCYKGCNLKDLRSMLETEIFKQQNFYFDSVMRDPHWKVTWLSNTGNATLSLTITKDTFTWEIRLLPKSDWSVSDKAREILQVPIASASLIHCPFDLHRLEWNVHSSEETEIPITLTPIGDLKPWWHSKLGVPRLVSIQGPPKLKIQVSAPPDHPPSPDVVSRMSMISGTYRHLEHCGTATESLFCKESKTDCQKVYLFLDQHPINHTSNDHFVFASSCTILKKSEPRRIIAKVSPKWRVWQPSELSKSLSDSSVVFPRTILPEQRFELILERCSLQILTLGGEQISNLLTTEASCHEMHEMMIMKLPEAFSNLEHARKMKLLELALLKNSFSLTTSQQWIELGDYETRVCRMCVPIGEDAHFTGGMKLHMKGTELEKAMRNRPKLHRISKDSEELRVSFGLQSMIHRAITNCSSNHDTDTSTYKVQWRLSHVIEPARFRFNEFVFKNTDNEARASEPNLWTNGGNCKLRADQLRALSWMKKRELLGGCHFTCQEVEEAWLRDIGLKLDVRAQYNVLVKGGILADPPSFGKTAVSIALISSDFEEAERRNRLNSAKWITDQFPTEKTDLLKTAATLILVPGHLARQWADEFNKFMSVGSGLHYQPAGKGAKSKAPKPRNNNIILINSVDELEACSIEALQNAKVVIASWDIFLHDKYVELFSSWAGDVSIPRRTIKERKSKRKDKSRKQNSESSRISKPSSSSNMESENGESESEEVEIEILGTEEPEPEENQKVKEPGTSTVIDHGHPFQMFIRACMEKLENRSGINKEKNETQLTRLNTPIFHKFQWNRLIVDEFAFLATTKNNANDIENCWSLLCGLVADKRWLLSGTPSFQDFHEVNRTASFWGIMLGKPDITPGTITSTSGKIIFSELSPMDKFMYFYEENRSHGWHIERRRQAQSFLHSFVRKNRGDPKVTNMRPKSFIVPLCLPPVQQVVCQEYVQFLKAKGFRVGDNAHAGGPPRATGMKNEFKKNKFPEETLIIKAGIFPKTNQVDLQHQRTSQHDGQELQELLLVRQSDRTTQAVEFAKQLTNALVERENDSFGDFYMVWKVFESFQDPNVKMWTEGVEGKHNVAASKLISETQSADPAKLQRASHAISIGTTRLNDCFRKPYTKVNTDYDDAITIQVIASLRKQDHKEPTGSGNLRKAISRLQSITRGFITSVQTERYVKSLTSLCFATGYYHLARGQTTIVIECTSCLAIDKCDPSDYYISLICGHIICPHCLNPQHHGTCPARGCNVLVELDDFKQAEALHLTQERSDTRSSDFDPYITFASLDAPNADNNKPRDKEALEISGLDLSNGTRKSQKRKSNTIYKSAHSSPENKKRPKGDDATHTAPLQQSTKWPLLFGVSKEHFLHRILTREPKPGKRNQEKALVFVQGQEVLNYIQEWFKAAGINVEIVPTQKSYTAKRRTAIENFMHKPDVRVLAMDIRDEAISGSNLTMARHIIFWSPYFTTSRDDYEKKMVQAIGRVVRTGQAQQVNIYHLVGIDTVDMDVLAHRHSEEVDGKKTYFEFNLDRHHQYLEQTSILNVGPNAVGETNTGCDLMLPVRYPEEFILIPSDTDANDGQQIPMNDQSSDQHSDDSDDEDDDDNGGRDDDDEMPDLAVVQGGLEVSRDNKKKKDDFIFDDDDFGIAGDENDIERY
ncbi:hypothetical protein BT63DRAFT_206268 [Microthyrium microscopicum]|uniref:Helicase ATP-binding domain-containing protein n=1 Tax=Microthyrium microscopicum TaxID=703497 RepID=A0A6A6UIY4_9PEZI|nr:hypothetical protein BT63DRAFT_206268 [Microthyrium microscopicum]